MTQTGMKENVAGLLCYVLGWLTGLIFFFIDKRSFCAVSREAIDRAVWWLECPSHHFRVVSRRELHGAAGWSGFSLAVALFDLLYLASVVLWIICMVKANQGERFRVPIVADFASKSSGNLSRVQKVLSPR